MPAIFRDANVRLEHARLPILNMIDKSVFLTAYEHDMNAIVKLMIIKHRKKFIKLINDQMLIDIFLGKVNITEKYENGGKLESPTLGDIINPAALLLIRTNVMKYKNKAAPGALEQCLAHRLDRSEPVWLLSYMNDAFSRASLSSSEGVWGLIQSSMLHVNIPPIFPVAYGSVNGNRTDMKESPLSPEPAESSKPKSAAKPRPAVRSAPDVDSSDPPDPPAGGLSRMGIGVKRNFRK